MCKDAPKAFFSFPAANATHSTMVIQVGPNVSGWDDRIHQSNRDFHHEVVDIQVDNQPPVVTIATPTEGLLTRTEAMVSGTVTDLFSGVKSLQGWVNSGAHFNVAFDASGHFQFDTTLPTDGSADGRHVVTLQATDIAGNVSIPATVSLVLDTTPPKLIQAVSVPLSGSAGVTDANPTISGVVTDAIAGVRQLQARIDGGPYFNVPFDAQGNFSFTTSLPTNGTADGTHSVFYRSSDNLGNAFTDLPGASFTLDTTAPVVTVNTPTGSPLTNQNLTISGKVTDNLSGVQSLKGELDGGSSFDVMVDAAGNFSLPTTLPLDGSADGSHTYQFQATDKAGNVSPWVPASFILDATPPVIALTSPGVSLTTNANITVNGTVTDNLSGVASLTAQVDGQPAVPVSFDPAGTFRFTTAFPLNGTADGLHAITFHALDKAGNYALPAGLTLTLDTTSPSIVITSPQAGSLHNVNVTVAGLVADQTSGVASLEAQLDGGSFFPVSFDTSSGAFSFVTQLSTDGSADGTHTFNLQATDQAGNTSPLDGVSFILDTTAPVITLTSPTGSPLTNQNLTITGQVTDNLSGVQSLEARLDSGPFFPVSFDASGNFTETTTLPLDHSADGAHTLQFQATDKAGNVSGLTPVTFTLDTTPPAVSFDLDPSTDSAPVGDQQTTFSTVILTGQTEPFDPVTLVETGATTTADASGKFSFANVPLMVGANLFHVQATDKAGNVSVAANTFTLIQSPAPCVFNDLTGWTTSIQGGTPAGQGTIGVQGDSVVLREGDSFQVALERTFVIPAGAASLIFMYDNLSFDTSSVGTIKDAFEASLVDPSGQSLVHTIGAGRDVYFNISEGQPAVVGSDATLSGQTVTLNLSGVFAGTTATLVIRLVNNDTDHNTSVAITCVELPTDVAVAPPPSSSISTQPTEGAQVQQTLPDAGSLPSGLVGSGSSAGQPALTVAAPGGGTTFPAGSTILLTGTASGPVTLNGTPVQAMDAAGDFFTSVVVTPGINTLDFASSVNNGPASTVTLTLEGVQPTPGTIDFTNLSNVSASFTGDYARTSFNEATETLYADLQVQNAGTYPAGAPLIVGVKNISDPTVRALEFDGVMPDGTPYYDFTSLMAGKTLAPGETTDYQSLEFLDPNRVQFTYNLVFLGQLNQPPAITSVPVVNAIAGQTYTYPATATDADSNPLTFSLTTAPRAMQVDPTSGQVAWSPTTADLGTHNVTLRVNDGLGGYATQSYVINVTTPPPDLPPYFTSEPVVDANVNTAYAYQATAKDPDNDPLVFSLMSGPSGMSVNPFTGLVSWTPSGDNSQSQSTSTQLDVPGETNTIAACINDSGEIAGQYNSNQSFLRNSAGDYTLVDGVPGEAITAAIGINNLGQVVGETGNSSTSHGFLRNADGTYTVFDFPGASLTTADDINDSGTIVGRFTVNGVQHGFLLSDGVYTQFDFPGASTTTGVGINDVGQVVGSYNNADGFLMSDGKYITIDVPGATATAPEGINNSGQIVGFYLDASGSRHGFLRDTDGTYTTIDAPFSGVTDTIAYRINDTGQIVGRFSDASGLHGFLLSGTAGVGEHNVSLMVSDGRGGTATQSYTILVQPEPGDHPPVIISQPVTTAVAGQAYTYPVKAIDPDGDPLTYSLTTAPQGMTIDPTTGVASWTAPPADPITEFDIPTPNSEPLGIAIGADGNIWFSEHNGNKIAKMSPAGTVLAEYTIPTPNSHVNGITLGPDGNIWFVEPTADKAGYVTPAGSFTEFPIVLPAMRNTSQRVRTAICGSQNTQAIGSDVSLQQASFRSSRPPHYIVRRLVLRADPTAMSGSRNMRETRLAELLPMEPSRSSRFPPPTARQLG